MSWRESADPRCPECGGKITATASYCMHCEADLPVDGGDAGGSEHTVLADDEFGAVEDEQMPSSDRKRQGSTSGGDRHRLDRFAGRLASMLWTDVPDPEEVPTDSFTAPLWMRLPVGIGAGLVVYFVFLVELAVFFSFLPRVISSLLGFFGFFAILWWLIRKPLPSDIVGDASYAVALLLLAIPILFLGVELTKIGLGLSESSLGETFVASIIIGVLIVVPTAVLLVVGYVGNRYARSKLDRSVEESTDTTNV